MRSATYRLFRDAILNQQRIVCRYDGYWRELCPVIIGLSDGEEKLLAYQVGGWTSAGPIAREGAWKCFRLAHVDEPKFQDGPWREGSGHAQTQTCVAEIDLDINIHVRKSRR